MKYLNMNINHKNNIKCLIKIKYSNKIIQNFLKIVFLNNMFKFFLKKLENLKKKDMKNNLIYFLKKFKIYF